MRRFRNLVLSLAAVALLGGPARAAPQAAEPAVIEADHVVIDDRQGISVYRGNVQMSQGGMRINADRVTVHVREQRIDKVIAEGGPVNYQQQAGDDKPAIRGEALRVEYDVDKRRLVLLEEARLWQGQSQFSGNRIEYDIAQDIVSATRAESEGSRVRVIIHPEASGSSGDRPSE